LLTLVMPGGLNDHENSRNPAPAATLRDDPASPTCASEYAECPEDDRRCILEPDHGKPAGRWEHVVTQAAIGRHRNRAGFAWDDREAAASALRIIAQLRADLASLREATR
jgi:hypothetical protein